MSHANTYTINKVEVNATHVAERDAEVALKLLNQNDTVIDKGPRFGKRHEQVIYCFALLFIGYTMRISMSLCIVAMTDPSTNNNKEIPTFNWTNRNIILSSFFWGYILPQILAGWLMTRYGVKWFLIVCMATGSVAGFLIPPLAVAYGSAAVIICRIIQGASQSFFVPSVACFTSKWIPAAERGRLGTFIYAASPMGSVISMTITGAISASPYGWPMAFHFFSVLGMLWCLFYFFCGYDSPNEHTSITQVEKEYIQQTAIDIKTKPESTPWKSILTSVPCWSLFYSYSGCILGMWTLSTQIPTYMNKIMQFDVKSNGALISSIYLTQWLISILTGVLSDSAINRKLLSVSTTRKIGATIGTVGPGIALLFLAQCTEEDSTKGVILMMVGVGLSGACYSSILINNADLSPNYSGVIQGMVNGPSHIFAIFAPLTVEYMVDDEYNPAQWKTVFYFTSGVFITGGIIFDIFASGDVQQWNNVNKDNDKS